MIKQPLLQLTITGIHSPFILTQLSGQESISKCFNYHLIANSETLLSDADLISKPTTVTITQGHQHLYLNGIITQCSWHHLQGNHYEYTLLLSPKIAMLQHEIKPAIYQQMTVLAIIQKICNTLHVAIDISSVNSTAKTRELCINYHETTLHFIERLLSEEGLFYFFRHSAQEHVMVITNNNTAFKPHPNQTTLSNNMNNDHSQAHITSWSPGFSLYSGVATVIENWHQWGNSIVSATTTKSPLIPGAKQLSVVSANENLYGDANNAQKRADYIIEAAEANAHKIQASSTYLGLNAGMQFTLQDAGDNTQSGNYYITEIYHHAFDYTQIGNSTHTTEAFNYHNSFSCLPYKTPYRSSILPKPSIPSVLSAKTVPDQQSNSPNPAVNAEKKVNTVFTWEEPTSTGKRTLVAESLAGRDYGTMFNPMVGDQLLLAFERGDIDRLHSIGSIHNQTNPPPWDCNVNNTRSGYCSASIKDSTVTEFNALLFEDKKGSEEIYIHAQKDYTRDIQQDDISTIYQGDQRIQVLAGSSLLEAKQAIIFKVGKNQLMINTTGIYINGVEIHLNTGETKQ